MSAENTALPCPFCGSSTLGHSDGYGSHWVCCDDCGASTSEVGIENLEQAFARWNRRAAHQAPAPAPIDMVLHCPSCGLRHVDAPEKVSEAQPVLYADAWTNPPHRSHLCHGCGHIWRPADVPTNGVAAVRTTGKADSPVAAPVPAAAVDRQAMAQECKRLAEAYATASTVDEKVTWDCLGTSAEEDAERKMWAARDALNAAIDALVASQPAATVPQGWQLVPIEPTPEMLRAGR